MKTNLTKKELLDMLKYVEEQRAWHEQHIIDCEKSGDDVLYFDEQCITACKEREAMLLNLLNEKYEDEKIDLFVSTINASGGLV